METNTIGDNVWRTFFALIKVDWGIKLREIRQDHHNGGPMIRIMGRTDLL